MNVKSSPKAKKMYPGEHARPGDIRLLADEYRKAAQALILLGKSGKPLTRAPYRLVAIHAIELYLNAFLLQSGCSAGQIRGLQHDFGARARLAVEKGILLRKRTFEHIVSLTGNREYLVSRYGPEMTTRSSEINRLNATMEELAKKVIVKI